MICKAPFSAITVNYDSTVKPCPNFRDSIKSNIDSLKDIQYNDKLNSVREHYQLNEFFHKSCTSCEYAELHGLNVRSNIYSDMKIENGIEWIDLRFSNACNLKCRTCSSEFSSSWVKDDFALNNKYNIKRSLPNDVKIKEDVFTEILMSKQTQILELKGGEPFLFLLKKLSTSDIDEVYVNELRVTTNGTILDENIMTFLKKFKKVDIKVSLDSISDKYFNIRNVNHDIIRENIKKIHQLNNVSLELQTVVSVYNIWDLPQVIDWVYYYFGKNKPICRNLHFRNVLQKPHYLSISILPKETLSGLIKHFRSLFNKNAKYRPLLDLETVLKSEMFHDDKVSLFNDFLKYSRALDDIRNENFTEIILDEIEVYAK